MSRCTTGVGWFGFGIELEFYQFVRNDLSTCIVHVKTDKRFDEDSLEIFQWKTNNGEVNLRQKERINYVNFIYEEYRASGSFFIQ